MMHDFSVEEQRRKYREDSLLHLYLFFFEGIERERIRFFLLLLHRLLPNNHRRSFLFLLFGNAPLN